MDGSHNSLSRLWKDFRTPLYSKIEQASTPEEFEHGMMSRSEQRRVSFWTGQFSALLIVSIISFLVGMWFNQSNDRSCAKQLSTYSPLLDAVEYEEVTFDGSFNSRNKFKGPPNPELDAAWENITTLKNFKVGLQNRSLVRKNTTTLVEGKDSEGEWFTGNLEVFHQLHCVDLVRQYTYLDYYNGTEHQSPWFTEHADVVRVHIDHCLDILRQAIQCYGDTTVITFDWMKHRSTPYPNFYTTHKCRKLEPLSDWVTKHLERGGEDWLEKPDGVPEIEHEHGH